MGNREHGSATGREAEHAERAHLVDSSGIPMGRSGDSPEANVASGRDVDAQRANAPTRQRANMPTVPMAPQRTNAPTRQPANGAEGARTRERANARTREQNAERGTQNASNAGWLIAVMAIALVIGELPLLLSACCAPSGATGLGTVWFVNDFAQYESAMRQGAEQPGWLIQDMFTAEPHPPTFMFPLYVGLGKLGAVLHVPAAVLERSLEVLGRAALVLALLRFSRAFGSGQSAARWTVALALFAGGFELLGALVGGYSGNWSYETNGFGLLFAAPHVPLGMAATLELARLGLLPFVLRSSPPPAPPVNTGKCNDEASREPSRAGEKASRRPSRGYHKILACRARRPALAWALELAFLSVAIALLHPFHLPVLLGAMLVVGIVFWRAGRGIHNLLGALIASVAAVPVLLPTVSNFAFGSFWAATYSLQNELPSPAPHELLVDLGPTLLLAVAGALMLRARVAPFGLLVWLLLALEAMYFPVPYQRRLSFAVQPALAVLAANTLVWACAALPARRAALVKLGAVAAASSGTLLVLVSVIWSGFVNSPLPVYRSTRDMDAAAAWLNAHAASGEVIMADWQVANYLAPRTPARVFGGHPVATLHASEKQFVVATVFAHADRLALASQLGAQWLVYGPDDERLPRPTGAAFESGAVRVYRLHPPE